MIIIIEGCDLSGKSTVVEDLKRYYGNGAVVFKNPIKPRTKNDQENIFVAYTVMFGMALKDEFKNKLVIFDRAYPSEMVYSKVKRNYEALNDLRWWKFDSNTAQEDVLMVYCYAPISNLRERLKVRGDDYVKAGELEKLVERYDRFLKKTKLLYVKIKSTDTREHNLLKILDFLQKHKNVIPY